MKDHAKYKLATCKYITASKISERTRLMRNQITNDLKGKTKHKRFIYFPQGDEEIKGCIDQ